MNGERGRAFLLAAATLWDRFFARFVARAV